jgi:hypothetical protein
MRRATRGGSDSVMRKPKPIGRMGGGTQDEAVYRRGFEAALRPALARKPYSEALEALRTSYPDVYAHVAVVFGHTARHGRRYDTYTTAAGGVQGLQALSSRHWPPLGAFIKLPALRVVHDLVASISSGGSRGQ